MAKKFSIVLLSILTMCLSLCAQNNSIDSLNKLLKNTIEDTNKIKLLQQIGREYNTLEQTSKSKGEIEKALNLSIKLKYKKGEFVCYNILARSCQLENNYPKAIEYYLKALKIAELTNNKIDIATSFQRIAMTHETEGNLNESLDAFSKALDIFRQLNLTKNISSIHIEQAHIYEQQRKNTLAAKEYELGINAAKKGKDTVILGILYEQFGNFYISLTNFKKALYFHQASLEVSKSLNDNKGVADSYSDIGNIYLAQKKYKEALENNLSALELYKKCADSTTIAESYMIIGQCYMYLNQITKAIDSHFSALKLTEQIGDKHYLSATVYLSLGDVYMNSKEYNKAYEYINKVVQISKVLKNEEMLKKCYQKLSDIAVKKQDFKSAYFFQKLFAQATDSIYASYNMEDKQIRQLQRQFEEEKKDNEKKLHEAQLSQKESELKQASTVRFALIAGLLLILVFSGFLYNRFKITQRQKETISLQKEFVEQKRLETESQKLVIEHKQKEIIESISYAKRLQEAILPAQEFVNKHIPDNFILYKPKDLVAGDFYWAEKVNDQIFIAAADSTGHGVPGAMVSVVCSNALNRAIKEFKETETGKILDKTRELVIETFEKSENDVKDGMDISLLCIDKKNKQLFWSGANNPLWYASNASALETNKIVAEALEPTIVEVKANKQPIGKTDNPMPFTTHNIPYHPGNIIYLFTDGFADQFGGPKGKKFKYKQFLEILQKIHYQPLNTQAELLNTTFENWKGDLEQVDDVCIIGIKL